MIPFYSMLQSQDDFFSTWLSDLLATVSADDAALTEDAARTAEDRDALTWTAVGASTLITQAQASSDAAPTTVTPFAVSTAVTGYSSFPDQQIEGTDASENLIGSDGYDIINGNGGDDFIVGGADGDSLTGGSGNDNVRGDDGNDLVQGNSGNDTLNGGAGNDGVDGGSGDDLLYGEGGDDWMSGGTGNDTMYGGSGDDIMDGGDGNDLLYLGEGNNVGEGGSGDDKIFGGSGNEEIFGQDGNDFVNSGLGDDVVKGGEGNDSLTGFFGDDTVSGDEGDDAVYGGHGNDVVGGGSGSDRVDGEQGNDIVHGDAGQDTLFGGDGDDTLEGGAGNDVLDGGRGNDVLYGFSYGGEPVPAQDADGQVNAGEPVSDTDTMTGWRGADKFVFRWLIDAKDEILDKHRDADGDVDYSMNGVAGENGAVHDHWVEDMGVKIVTDYSAAEGDELIFEGHTVRLDTVEHVDFDGDGTLDTVLKFISDQGANGGAHHLDKVGTVVVLDNIIDTVEVDSGVFYGVEDPYSALG